MKPMKKIPFEIEINISQVPNRLCRFYQERIYDYHADGRVQYEWDRIRQSWILHHDPTIEQICGPCPLNLLQEPEGCKGELFDFEVFLNALSMVKNDSLLLQKNTLNCAFTDQETAELIQELENLHEHGRMINWPVAQVYHPDGSPVISENSFKSGNNVFFEWTGEDEENYFTSNRGYHIGICKEGIVLKKNFGETLPDTFLSLAKKGFRVVGQTITGKTVPVPLNQTKLPEWFPDDPEGDSELRFTELPISDVFRDIFDMIIAYGQTALSYYVGVNIFSKFYRRA
ncbi:MAG: hypothetical protein LWY06_20860 [Firmicutes bacterium]|nr:hypothetical protein [Bacillota bacterium]